MSNQQNTLEDKTFSSNIRMLRLFFEPGYLLRLANETNRTRQRSKFASRGVLAVAGAYELIRLGTYGCIGNILYNMFSR